MNLHFATFNHLSLQAVIGVPELFTDSDRGVDTSMSGLWPRVFAPEAGLKYAPINPSTSGCKYSLTPSVVNLYLADMKQQKCFDGSGSAIQACRNTRV